MALVGIGDGVKVYLPPDFKRVDCLVTAYDEKTLRISARGVTDKTFEVHDIPYNMGDDIKDSDPYWVQLPPGYKPGSEGF